MAEQTERKECQPLPRRVHWAVALFIVALSAIAVASCATTQNYNDALSTWVGVDRDYLFKSWGPPDARADLMDGGEIVEYRREDRYKKPDNPGEQGLAHALGYKFGEWLAGGSKPPGCITRFHVSPSGVITEFKYVGEDCRTSDERKGELSYSK